MEERNTKSNTRVLHEEAWDEKKIENRRKMEAAIVERGCPRNKEEKFNLSSLSHFALGETNNISICYFTGKLLKNYNFISIKRFTG